jgi:hypothetical protein
MPGIAGLRRTQIGIMAAFGGTTDVATTYWRGMGMIDDTLEVTFPDENIGILGDVNRSYIGKKGGELPLEGDATFEQLPYIFQSGIKTVSPSTDASSAEIWTWAMQNATTDPISSSDLSYIVAEAGDNQQAEIFRSGFVREFSLKGAAGEALQVTATVQGREVELTTFTAGLSVPSVESILFSKGKLYIDPSSDTPGTTQKSQTFLDMSLDVTTGWSAIETADGRLDFSGVKMIGQESSLDITFEHDGSSVAEKAAYRAQNERVIRLEFEGSALSTTDAGATYDVKTLIIDLYGKWENFEPIGESDGNDVVSGTFHVGYSTVAAKKAEFIIANELATLP